MMPVESNYNLSAQGEFCARAEIPASIADVFAWHQRTGALTRLIPPWEKIKIIDSSGTIPEAGSEVLLQLSLGLLKSNWRARHCSFNPPLSFTDQQVEGPFSEWIHTHVFSELSAASCLLEDRIQLKIPFHSILFPIAKPILANKLRSTFRYRHRTLINDLLSHRSLMPNPKRILISGSSGLIGSQLSAFLSTGGHPVTKLARDQIGEYSESLENADIVIHLAGANIAERRWSDSWKAELWKSRVETTKRLVAAISRCKKGPKIFLSASAVGIYGLNQSDNTERGITESAVPGTDFLGKLATAWEAATHPLTQNGVRTVQLRFGVILTPQGGALAKMLPAFRAGLGAPLGSGEQMMSWCSIDDALRAIAFCCGNESISGPVNICVPEPVSNRDFSKTLARVLRRPLLPAIPRGILQLLFGEMAEATLLANTPAIPEKLSRTGFSWNQPNLESTLRFLLGKPEQ